MQQKAEIKEYVGEKQERRERKGQGAAGNTLSVGEKNQQGNRAFVDVFRSWPIKLCMKTTGWKKEQGGK